MKAIFLVFILPIGGTLFADEPSWTPEQRAAHRQVVIDARVTKVEKVSAQSGGKVELMRAELDVARVHKGKELLGDALSMEILFLTSPLGAGFRCPTFPVLKPKQRGRFYLSFDSSHSEGKAFVLGMGNDFGPIPLDADRILPELGKALRGAPTFDELSGILGEPHMDIGSGIHVLVYVLDKGASVTVGTADKKTVLFVERGGERLYPKEAEQDARVQPGGHESK